MTITKVKDENNLTTYKLSEVAQMDGQDSKPCWVIVNDLVYDVASFLEEHPGGKDLIMEFAGKDCTKDFNDAGHSASAMKDLKRCLVGQLVEEDQKRNRTKSRVTSNDKENQEESKKKRKFRSFFFCG